MGTIYSIQRWLERPEHGNPRWVVLDQYPTKGQAMGRLCSMPEGTLRIAEIEVLDHQPKVDDNG